MRIMARAAIPPTTPPATAPPFEEECLDLEVLCDECSAKVVLEAAPVEEAEDEVEAVKNI